MLNESIKTELTDHILEKISEGTLDNDNQDEWHHLCFNTEYYVTSNSQAEEWLDTHDLSAFDAIGYVVEYEVSNFGETDYKKLTSPEKVVNMLVYILGEEVMHEHSSDTISELWEWMGGIEGGCPLPDEDEEDYEDED